MKCPADHAETHQTYWVPTVPDYLAYQHTLVRALGKCALAMRMFHKLYYALPLPGEPTQDCRTQLMQLLDTELALLQVTLCLQQQADALGRVRWEMMSRSPAPEAARPPVRSPDTHHK